MKSTRAFCRRNAVSSTAFSRQASSIPSGGCTRWKLNTPGGATVSAHVRRTPDGASTISSYRKTLSLPFAKPKSSTTFREATTVRSCSIWILRPLDNLQYSKKRNEPETVLYQISGSVYLILIVRFPERFHSTACMYKCQPSAENFEICVLQDPADCAPHPLTTGFVLTAD